MVFLSLWKPYGSFFFVQSIGWFELPQTRTFLATLLETPVIVFSLSDRTSILGIFTYCRRVPSSSEMDLSEWNPTSNSSLFISLESSYAIKCWERSFALINEAFLVTTLDNLGLNSSCCRSRMSFNFSEPIFYSVKSRIDFDFDQLID